MCVCVHVGVPSSFLTQLGIRILCLERHKCVDISMCIHVRVVVCMCAYVCVCVRVCVWVCVDGCVYVCVAQDHMCVCCPGSHLLCVCMFSCVSVADTLYRVAKTHRIP